MRFTKIPTNTFDELQVEAGLLLKNFDPSTGAFTDEDIISATTGGITVNITPSFSDYGEDVDNCPTNCLELKRVDDIDVNVQTTAINISEDNIQFMLGASDIDQYGKITVRKTLKAADFKTIWYVGDMANGGFVAIKIKNALSTGGFSLKTTKKGKGNISLTLTGHFSIDNVDDVPVEIYLGEPEDAYITLSKTTLNLVEGQTAVVGVTYSDPSLIAEAEISSPASEAVISAEFTSDKSSIVVTAVAAGTVSLEVSSGTTEAACEVTVTAST